MFAPLINAAKANRVSRRTLADGSESLQPRPDQAGFGSVERILALQRTIGNQGVLRLLGRTPHDLTSQGAGHVVDAALQSSGQPLPPDTQRYFSAAFGHDFAGVRIHADAPAAASASALHANAYTVGKHIAFAPGRYQPGHHIGMRLLAHELAHVMQQRGGGAAPGPAQEQDAEAASRAVEVGATPNVAAASQVGIAAQPEDRRSPTSRTLLSNSSCGSIASTSIGSDIGIRARVGTREG